MKRLAFLKTSALSLVALLVPWRRQSVTEFLAECGVAVEWKVTGMLGDRAVLHLLLSKGTAVKQWYPYLISAKDIDAFKRTKLAGFRGQELEFYENGHLDGIVGLGYTQITTVTVPANLRAA